MTIQKKSLLASLLLALALLLPAVGGSAAAAEKAEPPLLSVSGEGTAAGTPDQAVLVLGVSTHAANAQTAQAENAKAAAAIRQSLLALGIAAKDIQTRDYQFHPTYAQEKGRENEINGYTANNSVTVELHDISLVGGAIDAALHHGANRVSSLSFGIRDARALRRDALGAAVRDARDKADIIAASLGKRIVGIRSVSESTGSVQTHRYDTMLLAKAANAATPIDEGTLTLDASVHIDFILSE